MQENSAPLPGLKNMQLSTHEITEINKKPPPKKQPHQDMPNIFIGSLEAAEANADSQKPLAAPHVAGRDRRLPHCQRLAAIQQHLDGLLHVHLQQLFQGVIVPVL